jgi:arylsulfatase A
MPSKDYRSWWLPPLLHLALLAFLAVSFTERVLAATTDRPNIILIMADDLGYGELGCYGQKWIKTPNLDRLAAEGLRFTQFYSGAPVCAPARCTLMTGKHLGHAAIRNNRQPNDESTSADDYGWDFPGQQPLPAEEVTIAELLKAKGYATAAIGKWGLGMGGTSGDPNKQGFDLFYGYLCQVHAHNHYPKYLWRNDKKEILDGNDATATGKTFSQDKFTEEALKFIRQQAAKADEPFFLYLPFIIPHLAIQAPEESLAEYEGQIPETPYKHQGYIKHRSPHAGYAAMISHMDRAVGKIVALVDELKLAENTLILFTSDNGPTYGRLGGADSDFFNSSGPLRGRKGSVYEGGIREPLIARWKGRIAPGRESDHAAAHWDILPTLCQIAGAEQPPGLDGISFAATLFGAGQQKKHEYLYWEFPAYGSQQAVRYGDWKAVRHGVNKGDPPFELYDLRADVGEQHDVASDHPDVIENIKRFAAAAHTKSELFPVLASDKRKRKARAK